MMDIFYAVALEIGVSCAPLFFCAFTGLEYSFFSAAPVQHQAAWFVRDTD